MSKSNKYAGVFQYFYPRDKEYDKKLILIQGTIGSRLLVKASRLSDYGKDKNGNRIKILRKKLEKRFGKFTKKNSLQRSPPRWVSRKFSRKAYSYVMKLK